MQSTGADDSEKKAGYLKGALESVSDILGGIKERFDDVDETIGQINRSTILLNQTMGGSASATFQIGKNLSDAASKVLLVSKDVKTFEEAINKAGQVALDIQEKTGRAYVATGKELSDIITAQEASGVKAGELVELFKEQGYSLQGIPKDIQKVIDTSKSLGVNVKGVTDLVVANLGKMNQFNFSNGVEGLTRMAAQAGLFGIKMDKIFTLADKLFDPERAVDLAASLQRLGVATGDLLDPLKLMDLGQNNPQELQNQIVEMSKRFTYFNEQNQKFEILPGAKRELREIADAVGLSSDELAKMALGSSDLAKKMNEIRFPDLKTTPITDDMKNLIANMAELRDGQYMVQIKETKVDEKGERVSTGREITKAITELSDDDLKSLQFQQKENNKSLEEIARDNLDYARRQTNLLESIAGQGRGMIATSRLSNKGLETINKTLDDVGSLFTNIDLDKNRQGYDKTITTVMDFFKELNAARSDNKITEQEKKKISDKASEIESMTKNLLGKTTDIFSKLSDQFFKLPKDMLSSFNAATVNLGRINDKTNKTSESGVKQENPSDVLNRQGGNLQVLQNVYDYSKLNNRTEQTEVTHKFGDINLVLKVDAPVGMNKTQLEEHLNNAFKDPNTIRNWIMKTHQMQDNYGVTGGQVGGYTPTAY